MSGNRGYDAGARKWVVLDDKGMPHSSGARICPDDRVELVPGVGQWGHCPECGRTADEMAQAPARYDTWDQVPSSATPEWSGQEAF